MCCFGGVRNWAPRALEADLEDERYDAPEARGLEVLLRGLSMVRGDHQVLELSRPLYDGLYEFLAADGALGRHSA